MKLNPPLPVKTIHFSTSCRPVRINRGIHVGKRTVTLTLHFSRRCKNVHRLHAFCSTNEKTHNSLYVQPIISLCESLLKSLQKRGLCQAGAPTLMDGYWSIPCNPWLSVSVLLISENKGIRSQAAIIQMGVRIKLTVKLPLHISTNSADYFEGMPCFHAMPCHHTTRSRVINR